MALFKIFKGNSTDLGKLNSPTQHVTEGYAYFTTDEGKFYIDITGDGTQDAIIGTNRIALNADKADRATNFAVAGTLDVVGHTSLSSLSTTGRITTQKPFNQIVTGTGTAGADSGSGDKRYKPAEWTFNTGMTATDGDIITVKIPIAGHDYGVFMSIDNGTTYYPIVCNGTGRLTTYYPVNTYLTLIFESTGSAASMFPLGGGTARITVSGGVWRVINFYDTNSDYGYYHRRIYPNIKAGPKKIFPYTMIMQLPDGRWESLVTSNSNQVGKSVNTSGFLLGHVLLMYANVTYDENVAVGIYNIWSAHSGLIDHRYSFNTVNNATNGTTGYKPVYLVGTVVNGLFYLDTTKWWSQTLPSTEDGKLYIYIGDAYDYYRLTFTEDKPIYYYTNGAVRLYSDLQAASTTDNGIVTTSAQTFAGEKTFSGNVNLSGETAADSLTAGNLQVNGSAVFVNTINGSIDGNAATATEFSSNATVTLTGDTTGTSTGSKKSWSIATTTKFLSGTAETTPALTTTPGTGKLKYSYNVSSGTEGLFAVTSNANSIITLNKHSGNYDSQLGFSSNGNIYYRNFGNAALNTTTAWKQIAFTDSSITGNADTATQWASAQTVYVTLGTASTTTTIQGGSSSAQTIGVDGTLAVGNGGTGATTFTSGALLIGNGTSAVGTRAITNNTSNTAASASTNIPTMNTLYYTLAKINNSDQTHATTIYAPTGAGTANQILVSAGGTSAPTWKATANGAAYATSANGALTFGTLPIAQGGTGKTTWDINKITYASATDTLGQLDHASSTSYLLKSGSVSAAPSWIQYTNANTASTIVQRDASGNFSAGTITATLSGNATTATGISTTGGTTAKFWRGDNTWSNALTGNLDLPGKSGYANDITAGLNIATGHIGVNTHATNNSNLLVITGVGRIELRPNETLTDNRYSSNNKFCFENKALYPGEDSTFNFGSTSQHWSKGYFDTMYVSNDTNYTTSTSECNGMTLSGDGWIDLTSPNTSTLPHIDFKINKSGLDYQVRLDSNSPGRIRIVRDTTNVTTSAAAPNKAANLTYNSKAIDPVFHVVGVTYINGDFDTSGTVYNNVGTQNTGGYYIYGKNASYGRFYIGTFGTAGTYTQADGGTPGTQGEAYLVVGNSTNVTPTSATALGAGNARGRIRLYGTGTKYTELVPSQSGTSSGHYTQWLPCISGYSVTTEDTPALTMDSWTATNWYHYENVYLPTVTATGQAYISDIAQLRMRLYSAAGSNGYAALVLGNTIAQGTAKNAYGFIRLYSQGTNCHNIYPTSTTTDYSHYLPNSTGWIATGGNGTSTGVGGADQIVYLSTTGVLTAGTSATNANTASTIVKRDASGNFTAGTITATLSGNASTATKVNKNLVLKVNSGTTEGTNLYTFNGSAAKTINVIAGDGITLTAASGSVTVSGTTITIRDWTVS